MYGIVAASLHFTYTIVYYGFYFSYKIGQFLVTTINLLLQNFTVLVTNFIEAIVIILESFTIFSQDIVHCFQQVLRIVLYLVEVVFACFYAVWSDVTNAAEALVLVIVTLYDIIVSSILSVITVLGQIFVFLKRLLILFGSGVWFAVTFIPLLIVYLGTLCTYYIRNLIAETVDSIAISAAAVKTLLKNFYEFITDVPIESVAGITIAFCLVYILTHVYNIIYSYMYEQARNVYQRIDRRYHRLRRRQPQTARIGITPRRRPQIRSQVSSIQTFKNESSADERYCVICQERIKCILVLPCRHVCMCDECSNRLQLYNNTCPICRKDIESTMKIFV